MKEFRYWIDFSTIPRATLTMAHDHCQSMMLNLTQALYKINNYFSLTNLPEGVKYVKKIPLLIDTLKLL